MVVNLRFSLLTVLLALIRCGGDTTFHIRMEHKKMANMSDTLRSAMQASGFTDYRISRMTGVHASIIGRFLKGERGISLTTAGKIAEAVGVELR